MPRNKLDAFTQAYIDAALWPSTDKSGEPLDSTYSRTDLAPDALARMAADCARFQTEQFGPLALSGLSSADAGHDFWLTRNRHGTGFWDRGLDYLVGRDLTEAAHAYGEVDLYVGIDELIHD